MSRNTGLIYPTVRRIETYFGGELIVLLINMIYSEYSLSIEKKPTRVSVRLNGKQMVAFWWTFYFSYLLKSTKVVVYEWRSMLDSLSISSFRVSTDVSSRLTMLNSKVQIILDVDIHFHADIVSLYCTRSYPWNSDKPTETDHWQYQSWSEMDILERA